MRGWCARLRSMGGKRCEYLQPTGGHDGQNCRHVRRFECRARIDANEVDRVGVGTHDRMLSNQSSVGICFSSNCCEKLLNLHIRYAERSQTSRQFCLDRAQIQLIAAEELGRSSGSAARCIRLQFLAIAINLSGTWGSDSCIPCPQLRIRLWHAVCIICSPHGVPMQSAAVTCPKLRARPVLSIS